MYNAALTALATEPTVPWPGISPVDAMSLHTVSRFFLVLVGLSLLLCLGAAIAAEIYALTRRSDELERHVFVPDGLDPTLRWTGADGAGTWSVHNPGASRGSDVPETPAAPLHELTQALP